MMHMIEAFPKLFFVFIWVSEIQITIQSDSGKVYEISKSKVNQVGEKFGDLFWNHIELNNGRIKRISIECDQKLKIIISNSDEHWASGIKKSSGQFPDDFDQGTVSDFGKYDQCLQSKFPFKTSYCMASFIPREEVLKSEPTVRRRDSFYRTEFLPELSFYLKIGLCVPEACSSEEISAILDEALNHSRWRQAERCRCERNSFQLQDFTALEAVSILSTTLLVLLVSWAGLTDIRRMMGKSRKSNFKSLYLCFSPRSNLVELFSGSNEPRWKRIELLRLLRAQISFSSHALVWPILTGPSLIAKVENLRELFRKFLLQPLVNTFYLEAFIFTGCLSSAITLLNETDRNTPLFGYLKLILFKFMSSLPILLGTMFFEVTFSLFYKGPGSLTTSQSPSEACNEGLLYHLLQIKGSTGQDILCAPHLWNISTEFHLFIIACALIYIYHRRSSLAKILMGVLTISCLAYTVSNFYRFNLPPDFFSYPFKIRDFYRFKSGHFQSTSNHVWSLIYSVLLIVLLKEKFHRTLTNERWKIFTYLTILISIICSFSSMIYNVFEIEMGALAITAYKSIIYSGLTIILGWVILSSDDEETKLSTSLRIRKSSSTSDSDEESSPLKIARERKSRGRNHVLGFNWMLIFMKLSEVAYFPSTMIILAFNSNARKPIDVLSIEQLWSSIAMYLCILASAPIFHILVIGPTEKLMDVLKTGAASKDEAKSE